MNARSESEPVPVKNRTTVERTSDREVVVTRTINGPAPIVFEAFTKAELFKRWWVPKSMGMTLLSCELDARVGGKYRLVFDHSPSPPRFSARISKCSRIRDSRGPMTKAARADLSPR